VNKEMTGIQISLSTDLQYKWENPGRVMATSSGFQRNKSWCHLDISSIRMSGQGLGRCGCSPVRSHFGVESRNEGQKEEEVGDGGQ
jgi:hypothetical protein